MKKLLIMGATLALAIPATAYAAADCCKGMTCCKEADCRKDMKKGGDHAGHNMPAPPAK
jgi:hypothetical protein